MKIHSNYRKQNGFSILEVVIGIFIFIVGMLALAALQGALTRSMADSKLRTTAVKLADRAIERQHGFTQLLTAATPGVPFAYNDIVTLNYDETRPPITGVTYNIDIVVTDYYYQLATDTLLANEPFTTVNTLGASSSDFKQVDVTVTWDAVQGFRGDEGAEIDSVDLNTGSVNLTSTIPAVVTSASARVSDESDGSDLKVSVGYTPGSNPDIVALDLGGGIKFKESLLPEPDVIRSNELVQTTFDVITYSSSGGDALFLRREEFAAVSCECTLRAASSLNPARRPAIWAGDEYAGGHWVEKPYGESANNQQSSLCDSCCRDHHDGGAEDQTGDSGDDYANVFGPFKAYDEYVDSANPRLSDHLHYEDDAETIASTGDDYLENCRLVRVDGFWRVAQDFRREDQYIFPDDFLDNANETEEFLTYSGYVTSAAAAYTAATTDGYPTSSTPCIGSTGCALEPDMQLAYSNDRMDGELPSWTSLVTTSKEEQQLRSRGIYIDYMSADLRLFLSSCFVDANTLKNDCCIREGAVANACTADDLYLDKVDVNSANQLEIIPFFEVQLTKLENWKQEVQAPLPIGLTNEPLADANLHSRGVIEQLNLGDTEVKATSHRGNIGFTNTLAIDPVFEMTDALLNVHSLDAGGGGGGGGGGPDPTVIAGNFTESVPGNPTIAVMGESDDIACTLVPNGYTCSVADGATSGSIRVYDYEGNPNPRYACSETLDRIQSSSAPGNTFATFNLFVSGVLKSPGTAYDITITETDCP